MDLPGLAEGTDAAAHRGHLVEFYDTESFLVDTVRAVLAPALRSGDVAVVVATAAHRHMFEAALHDVAIDIVAAKSEGRYLTFDAAALLTRFMVDGRPDPARFRDTIGPVLDGATEGGRRVRVYGEMVALLWDDGQVASAIALEDLWNDLAKSHDFLLLCAYPMRSFGDVASTTPFGRICEQHTTVIPSEGYSLVADPAERSRAVARLQQQATALRPRVLRLRAATTDRTGDQRDRASDERDRAGDHRDRAGQRRDRAGVARDEAGDHRDQVAARRDSAAEKRDQAAAQRDDAAERSEASTWTGVATGPPDRPATARREAASDRRRASQDRRAGAAERILAESDRDTALADRGAGACERTHAELDRDTAVSDRGAWARERAISSRDALTGAYQRGAGFMELDREIARARRADAPLVLAFIDVDGLKAVNDSGGHAAGDRLLVEVVTCFLAAMRSYDMIVRYGGDEFVCVFSGLDLLATTTRLGEISEVLARAPEHGSVTVGVAELQPGDSVDDLVARADDALYQKRRQLREDQMHAAGLPGEKRDSGPPPPRGARGIRERGSDLVCPPVVPGQDP